MTTDDPSIEQWSTIISSLALLVAVMAIIVQAFKSDRDNKTVIRQQMNALVSEINAVIVENVEMVAMIVTNKQELDLRTYKSMLVLQRASPLSMQAVFLLNQMPKVMNEMDYYLTADISRIATNWEIANQCYRIAIRKGERSTAFNKITFRRGYASILFDQSEYDEGRKWFNNALSIADSDSDLNKHMNGYTYLLWYQSESHIVLGGQSSDEHYLKSKQIFESISNVNVRETDLNLLEAVKSKLRPG